MTDMLPSHSEIFKLIIQLDSKRERVNISAHIVSSEKTGTSGSCWADSTLVKVD